MNRRSVRDFRPIEFSYRSLPYNVLFHDGAITRLPDEVRKLGSKALLLCTPEQRATAESARRVLGELAVGIFDRATMHVPREIVQEARATAEQLGANVCVAIGGGSTIGLGKAIALVSEIPIIAVPTTYAGSEMTQIWGMTASGLKQTGRDPRVLPRTVIYDPNLTVSLPVALSVTSGINALAHCAEAMYAHDTNPILQLMAEEGIRVLAVSLPVLVSHPADMQARSAALYGAWLAGTCLGSAGVALHHKLCHVLGGTCNLPHSETHTIVLPHVLAYNASAVPEAMLRISRALSADDVPKALFDLAGDLGAKMALKDLGMAVSDIERVVEVALQNPYWNPEPVTSNGLRRLLRNAYWGARPAAAT
jgi:maleylacetate reductase